MQFFHRSVHSLHSVLRLKDDVLYNDINDIITIESFSCRVVESSLSKEIYFFGERIEIMSSMVH